MSTPEWHREPGARLAGSRPLDAAKVQAPCILAAAEGGYRLFYTGVGPGRPFAACQGYVLSARSVDGLTFTPEPGIRVAPDPGVPHLSRRALAPSVVARREGGWRMYFEARGPVDQPTVICSAVSDDQLRWRLEDGIRLKTPGGVGAPRFHRLRDGRGRLFCWRAEFEGGVAGHGARLSQHVVSAVGDDDVHFALEPGIRLPDRRSALDAAGITAAEAVPPSRVGEPWLMLYSAWQDVPAGTIVPPHPSVAPGMDAADFAAASIAADIAGYRSRIFCATSGDGRNWSDAGCVVEGGGYDSEDIDAVHAEDMSLIRLPDGRLRMFYAACDRSGVWRIASAVTVD